MYRFLRSSIAVSILAIGVVGRAQTFGTASPFNAYTAGQFMGFNSDVEGRLAVGGDATLNNYSVGVRQPGGDVLVIAGDFHTTGGSADGNVKYGGSEYAPSPYVFSATGTKGHADDVGLNFGAVTSELRGLSHAWGAQTATGSTYQQWSTLNFVGTDAGLNVFTVDAGLLNSGSVYEYKFSVPNGASALVNVVGTNVNFRNVGYNGIDPTRLIWNLPNATSLSFDGSVKGSVLAIDADTTGTWGALDGQFFAKSFAGPTQFNHYSYNGAAPVPEPASMAVLGVGLAALRRRRAKK